jgi:hypothetical protein
LETLGIITLVAIGWLWFKRADREERFRQIVELWARLDDWQKRRVAAKLAGQDSSRDVDLTEEAIRNPMGYLQRDLVLIRKYSGRSDMIFETERWKRAILEELRR